MFRNKIRKTNNEHFMRHLLQILTASVTLIAAIFPAQAQTQARDAVYLKNGSIIKGKITEIIPDTTVKIQTADGSIYAYSMSEVGKITDGPNIKGVTLFAGISEPISYFGELYGSKAGRAKEGFALGIDVSRHLVSNIAWMSSANLSVHKSQIDVSKTWNLGWLMTGWEVTGNPVPKIEVFGFGQGGLLLVRAPGSWFFNDSKIVTGISIPDYTFGFGLGAGMNIDHISLRLRLLCSEPEYDITVRDIIYDPYEGISYTEPYKSIYRQPIYCLQIAGGYTF